MLDQYKDNDQKKIAIDPLTLDEWLTRFGKDKKDTIELQNQYLEIQKIPGFIEYFHSWSPKTQHSKIRWVQLGLSHESISTIIKLRVKLQQDCPNYDWSKISTHGLKDQVRKIVHADDVDEFEDIIFDFAIFQRSAPTGKGRTDRLAIHEMNETGVLLLMAIYGLDVLKETVQLWTANKASREFHHFAELLCDWGKWRDYPIDWAISTFG